MDEADIVVENSLKEDEYRKKEFALRVARMEQGEPGECAECGETFNRLVKGYCGACRDWLTKMKVPF